MADALPGAVAPIPAAVRASHPTTTTPQGAAELPPLISERATRMLALVDMARALPLGDTPVPDDDESTDRDDKLSALLHCLTGELQALYLAARGASGEEETVLVSTAAGEEETVLVSTAAGEEETVLVSAATGEEETVLVSAATGEETVLVSAAAGEETVLVFAATGEETVLVSAAAGEEETVLVSTAAGEEETVLVPAAAAGDPVPSLAEEVSRMIGAAVGRAEPGDADIVIELVEALRHLSPTWAGAPKAVDPAAAVESLRTVTARERGVSAERLKLIDTATAALLALEVADVAGVPIVEPGNRGERAAVAPDADRVGCPQRPAAAPTAVHQSAPDAVELTQRVGELACLVATAADLAADADRAGDMGGLWRLRCLLGAMRPQADSLHEMAALAEGGAA